MRTNDAAPPAVAALHPFPTIDRIAAGLADDGGLRDARVLAAVNITEAGRAFLMALTAPGARRLVALDNGILAGTRALVVGTSAATMMDLTFALHLVCLAMLRNGDMQPGFLEVPPDAEEMVARAYLDGLAAEG